MGDLTGLITPGGAAFGQTTSATIASGSAVSLTTATAKTVTSISLAPGTYHVWGIVDYSLAAASATEFRSGVSLVTNTLPTQPGGSGLGTDALDVFPLITTTLTDVVASEAGPTTLTITVTTTLFLIAQATFSAGTISAFGSVFALRVA